jgi:CBS domain-containing protein
LPGVVQDSADASPTASRGVRQIRHGSGSRRAILAHESRRWRAGAVGTPQEIEEAEMTKAREVMHMGAECIGEDETLAAAARKMRELHIGALPICGEGDRLHGIVTDRDIVVKCIADGRDPQTVTARELAQGTPIWVDAQSDIGEVLWLMGQNAIRRLPVVDNRRLIGMITEADLATHLGEHEVSEFAAAVCSASPSS